MTRPGGGPPLPPVAVLGDRPASRAAELARGGCADAGGRGALGSLARATPAADWRDRAAKLAAQGQLQYAAEAFRHAGASREEAAVRAQLAESKAAAAERGGDAAAARLAWLAAAAMHCAAGAPGSAEAAARAAARLAASAADGGAAGADEAALADRLQACAARRARA